MSAIWFRAGLAVLVLLAALPAYASNRPVNANTPGAPYTNGAGRATQIIEGQYIVVLRNDVIGAASVTATVKQSKVIKVEHEFSHAFQGFSAEMSKEEA